MLTRMYVPGIARFSSVDSLFGRIGDPLSMNQFIYSQDNPVTYWDPTGMHECSTGGGGGHTVRRPCTSGGGDGGGGRGSDGSGTTSSDGAGTSTSQATFPTELRFNPESPPWGCDPVNEPNCRASCTPDGSVYEVGCLWGVIFERVLITPEGPIPFYEVVPTDLFQDFRDQGPDEGASYFSRQVGREASGFSGVANAANSIARTIGRNRVTIRTATGRIHIDLRGRAHFEKTLGEYVSTPHVRFDMARVSPRDSSTYYVRGTVRPATWADIRMVSEFLGRTAGL
jgi:hypothetical protein